MREQKEVDYPLMGVVKVFIDAQHDYIADRVYLLAALVAGPEQTTEVVEMTAAPPDTAAEQMLALYHMVV